MSEKCHFRNRALQQGGAYSINSSANVSKVGGAPMPDCLAILARPPRIWAGSRR